MGKKAEQLHSVTKEEVEIIRKITSEKRTLAVLNENQRVEFINGAFMGMEGNGKKLDRRRENVMLEIKMMGSVVEVWTAIELLKEARQIAM